MTKNYVSNKNETVRMFESDFLEMFSRVHWTVPLYIFVPVILFFLYKSIFIFGLAVSDILTYFVSGIVVWTFTEYGLHKYVFHFRFQSEFGKRIHFMFHGVHHDYPNDSKRLVMPPSVSIPLASLFYLLFYVTVGFVYVAPFFAGFILGYLFYDITHYAVHHFNIKNKFWLAIKNHHMIHHYKNSELGFGVSQPAWDHVFGTTFGDEKTK